MIMVQLARLELQHVLTALARQCTVESVRRWVSETYNMLISNSHMQWVLLSTWYCSQLGYCLICWVWSCWVPLGTNKTAYRSFKILNSIFRQLLRISPHQGWKATPERRRPWVGTELSCRPESSSRANPSGILDRQCQRPRSSSGAFLYGVRSV